MCLPESEVRMLKRWFEYEAEICSKAETMESQEISALRLVGAV
jgi:hypothetical protein